MAKWTEWTPEQKQEWAMWVASRPPEVRALAERYPGDTLYRLKTTGQRVCVRSYFEDGTVKVLVSGKYNFVAFQRAVFGIDPDDLEECELPEPGELLGSFV